MGRRDEPEPDELSKLLRRLETMPPPPKQESSRKPEPDAAQPQPEYVGALRGAAPAKISDGPSVSSYDAVRPYRAPRDKVASRQERATRQHHGGRYWRNDRGRGVLGYRRRSGDLDQHRRGEKTTANGG